jgi:fibronectin-binding autotransporter adhesin
MKTTRYRFALPTAATIAALSGSTQVNAAQIWKAGSTGDLNLTSSWWTTETGTTNPASIGTTDALRFGGSGQGATITSIALGGNLTVGGIRLDNNTGTPNYNVTIAAGNTLTLNGASTTDIGYANAGIVLNSGTGGTLTINADIVIGASQQWVTSRAFTASGTISLGANTLSFNTAGASNVMTLSGVISGTGGLNKTAGPGTLVLGNTDNTFGGQVTLVGGTTQVAKLANIGSNSSLGTGSGTSTINMNGAVLAYIGAGGDSTDRTLTWLNNGNNTINNNSGTGAITLSGNVAHGGTLGTGRTITLGGSNTGNNTFSGNIVNPTGFTMGLIKSNAGTWVLTGSNGYTGSTLINQGILRITGSGSLGGATGSTATANNLEFTSTNSGGRIEFETTANLGAADQIRFRNTGGTVGQGGALVYIGTTAQTLSKTIQCDTSIGIRLESDSVGGSLTFDGAFSQTNRALYLGGTGTGNNTLATAFTGSGGITKRDAGTWVLSVANTYTGATNINGGTLVIGTSGSLANTAVTVGGASASGTPTLAGGGTIGGATTIAAAGGGAAGTHSVGVAGVNNGVGTQTFSGTLTYGSGSVFEWNLQAVGTSDIGVVSNAATGTYDKVVANGSLGGEGAEFKIVLGGNSFSDAFWDTNKSWTDIFSGTGAGSWGSVFSSITGDSINWNAGLARGEVGTQGVGGTGGYFTISGSSLNWTAVPEPGTALGGLLLTAGLLRRRRTRA